MFSYFKGKIIEKNLQFNFLVIEVNNIGYKIETNQKTLAKLRTNDEIQLYTWTSSNDDGIRLCGFLNKAEKELFEMLIKIPGLGPKAAQNILNVFEVDNFISAVLKEETKLISSAQGIGKKTAERIILEMKSKLGKIQTHIPDESVNSFTCQEEVYSILEGLGFDPLDINSRLEDAKAKNVVDDVELLVRHCMTA